MKEKKDSKPKEDIQKLLEEETKLKEEYLDNLKRLKAEFENYQKRIDREKIEFIKYAKEDLILNLLEILDNFERALCNCKDDEFSKGINLIFKQLKDLLEKEGIKEIEKLEKFDPEKHEALIAEKGEEGKILEELQKGYILHNKIIRPAKVKVGRGEKNEINTDKKWAKRMVWWG